GLDQPGKLWHLIGRSFDARHLAPWSWRDVAPSPWRVTSAVARLERLNDRQEPLAWRRSPARGHGPLRERRPVALVGESRRHAPRAGMCAAYIAAATRPHEDTDGRRRPGSRRRVVGGYELAVGRLS